MRTLLLKSLFARPVTTAAPSAADVELVETGRALEERARKLFGRAITIREVEQSVALIAQILDLMAPGEIMSALPAGHGECEGLAVTEAFRGDVLVWLRLDRELRVQRCHLRDASWFQWPLLEAAIEQNIVADFPLCNKSFNCSYSGADI